ncbi:MAG: hypothetical protein ACKOI2_07055, partial [Actinomycetota bacterium]
MKDVDSSPSGESTPVDSVAARTPLPEGTLAVGGGLLVAGLSSYAFFKVGQEGDDHAGDCHSQRNDSRDHWSTALAEGASVGQSPTHLLFE